MGLTVSGVVCITGSGNRANEEVATVVPAKAVPATADILMKSRLVFIFTSKIYGNYRNRQD
jgi:hypothetical protein